MSTSPTNNVGDTSVDRTRAHRSRKNRPCDRCRRSKLRCNILGAGPCTRCSEVGKQCTFEAAPPPRPPKRQRTEDDNSSEQNTSFFPNDLALEQYMPPPQQQQFLPSASVAPIQYMQSNAQQGIAGTSAQQPRAIIQPPRPVVARPLSVANNANAPFDQLTQSRFDPQVLTTVLTDDLLPISGADENDAHVRQISSDPTRPIYVVMQPKGEVGQLPVAGAVPLQHIRTLIRHQAGVDEAHLLKLYHTHVHPAVPIIPPGDTSLLSPLLLSAILATATNHSKTSRSLAASCAGLLSVGCSDLPENNLAGVASAVLELDLRPNNSSRASYLLMSKTIALAQLLGMHMDPTRWSIPAWEQDLRVRLWWTLTMHDAWMSFLNSRPCHIQGTNTDTPLPRLSALLEAGCAYGSASSDSAKAYITSCRLALLVRRLQSDVCVLGVAAARYSENKKAVVRGLQQEANALLAEWPLHSTTLRPTGVNSLLIHLLGFRCMLRRIQLEFEHGLGSAFKPSKDDLEPFRDCVQYISALNPADLDGYFMIYSAHILSSLTSSLIRLALSSPDELNAEAMGLLSRLLRVLHRFQAEHAWELGGPALRRAEAMASRLDEMQEHSALAVALRGGSTDVSPLDFTGVLADLNLPEAMPGADSQLVWDWSDWNLGDMNLFPS